MATRVTATVVDPNGIPYALGSVLATLIVPGGASPTVNGQFFVPSPSPGSLDTAGKFSMTLQDNTQISPGSTQWLFTVSSAAGSVPFAAGAGPVTFSVAITISGASQDISATLQAAAPRLTASISGTISGLTVNAIPKATAANALGNSALSDNGTTVTSSEPISAPGAGANTERFGAGAVAGGFSSVAFGNGASAAGTQSVAIGMNAATVVTTGANSVVVGFGSSSAGNLGVAIGPSISLTHDFTVVIGQATEGGANAVAIGRGASAGNTSAVAIGNGANVSGSSAVGIGINLTCSGASGVAIGLNASTTGTNGTAVGRACSCGHAGAIAIGFGSATTAIGQLVAGSTQSQGSITDVYCGNGVTAASPVSVHYHATGGSGTDIVGGDITLDGGISTGAGASGKVVFRVTQPSVSGTNPQSLVNAMTIQGLSAGVATTQINMSGYFQWAGQARVTSQIDVNASTTPVTVHSIGLVSGRSYQFRWVLHVTADAVGGQKYSIGGLTPTATIYQVNILNNSTNAYVVTSRQTTFGSTTQVGSTSNFVVIEGTITVNVGGTLSFQFAQAVASGTSSVLVGSSIQVFDIA